MSDAPQMAFQNPFRPGAGHMPPYLAGRVEEEQEFRRLLAQSTILENMILTGLRGVGKTVLSEKFKPIALQEQWLWVGADLSETVGLSEANLAIRLLTDLSVVTSSIKIKVGESLPPGFGSEINNVVRKVDFTFLSNLYESTPGLPTDKLKAVLEFVWSILRAGPFKGIVFAYDEAQNLADNTPKDQYPLSVMLEVFQSIQRKNIPFMLILVGLPTLFPKLVEARTYAERMFRVVSLAKLNDQDSADAIAKPVEDSKCPIKFTAPSIKLVTKISGGYPYFIQFICREVYDIWIQAITRKEKPTGIPHDAILRKLDSDFFAGRWAKATDRQRELLTVISHLDDGEFSVQEIVELSSARLDKPFSASHVSQMLVALINGGLVYKNRHGKYSFAVPLMGQFIIRQTSN